MTEPFAQVIFYISSIVYIGTLYFIFKFVFKPAVKGKYIFLVLAAYTIVSSQLFFAFDNVWINISVSISAFVIIALLFSGNLSTRLILALLLLAMSVVADGLAFLGVSYVFYLQHGTELPAVYLHSIARPVVTILTLSLSLIAVMLFRKFIAEKANLRQLKVPRTYTLSALFIIVGILSVNALFVSSVFYNLQANTAYLSASLALSSILILFVIWLYSALLNHLKLLDDSRLRELVMERWDTQQKTALDSHKVIARLNHNLRYNFLTLRGYLTEGSIDEAMEHIETQIGQLSHIINTENMPIDALLNYYQERIKNALGIDLTAAIVIPPKMKLDANHIVTVVGNALENAMEACEKVEPALRRIYLQAAMTERSTLLFTVVNSYSVEPVADKVGNLLTTKGDSRNHGFGLSGLRDILPENKGQVHFEYADNEFRFMATFYGVLG